MKLILLYAIRRINRRLGVVDCRIPGDLEKLVVESAGRKSGVDNESVVQVLRLVWLVRRRFRSEQQP